MKNILTFIAALFAVSCMAAPFQQNQFTTNSPAGASNAVSGQITGRLANANLTNSALYNPTVEDDLNIGPSGSFGSFTFAPGPANAWMDFTFAPNAVTPLRFHITGNPMWTGVASGSGNGLTDIPISGLNTNSGTNGQIATIGTDGAVHWSNAPPSSSSAGVDVPMTFTSPYANNTNFNIDFTFAAQTLNTPTNIIVFNYSTNWGLSTTSRVANIFIQWTNFGRLFYFVNQATNWHVQPNIWYLPPGYGAHLEAQAFGPLDTNVTLTTFIDSFPVGSNTTASFNPTNVFPSATKLWLDASRLAYQDEASLTPVQNGSVVRAWTDLSKFTTGVSNNNSLAMTIQYQAPQSGPYNVPNLTYTPGATWMQSPAFGSLGPPMWAFIVFYGRNMGTVLDCVGTRFACQPGESGQSMSFFSGSGLQANGQGNTSWVLFSFFSNSPNSIIRTNGNQAVLGITGNPAATAWLVGSDNSKTAAQGTANIAEILILQTNLTATQVTNVESYFYRKYPFWTPPTVQ